MDTSHQSHSASYAESGVDITAGYRAVELMREHVARTLSSAGVSGENIGGFGGTFRLGEVVSFAGMADPCLVSGTDGVGTKIRLAQLLDVHNTIGIDCVAMCVNDIICSGARPLLFLDYIACGKNNPEHIASIVEGVAEGCVQAGCALIGGETAEHPGLMTADDYDLAGFSVGLVDKSKMVDASRTQVGDKLIALPSSGVHSNGFSLVRKVFDVEHADLKAPRAELDGESLGNVLLAPTVIYVKAILALLESVDVHGIAHITGGGFYENIPRALPEGYAAHIDQAALRIPPIFSLIAHEGNISDRDMFNTFNMGVGMCVTVPANVEAEALELLSKQAVQAYTMGEIVQQSGNERVILC